MAQRHSIKFMIKLMCENVTVDTDEYILETDFALRTIRDLKGVICNYFEIPPKKQTFFCEGEPLHERSNDDNLEEILSVPLPKNRKIHVVCVRSEENRLLWSSEDDLDDYGCPLGRCMQCGAIGPKGLYCREDSCEDQCVIYD